MNLFRWVDVKAASGAAEHPGLSTRSGQAQSFTYQRNSDRSGQRRITTKSLTSEDELAEE